MKKSIVASIRRKQAVSELLTRRTDFRETWNLPDTTFGPVALKSPDFRLEMLVGWYQEWPRSIPSAQEF